MWKIAGLGILGGFYGVYLWKLFQQKRRGIRTRQLIRGKTGKRLWTEIGVTLATYAVIPAQVIGVFSGSGSVPLILRCLGAGVGTAGVAVFALAVWRMGDSWRAGIPSEEKTELVRDGIYRFSRNPAFLGFDLVYAGITMMFFSTKLLVLSMAAALMLHLQILQEERYLSGAFGEAYLYYAARVNRYLGRKKSR